MTHIRIMVPKLTIKMSDIGEQNITISHHIHRTTFNKKIV